MPELFDTYGFMLYPLLLARAKNRAADFPVHGPVFIYGLLRSPALHFCGGSSFGARSLYCATTCTAPRKATQSRIRSAAGSGSLYENAALGWRSSPTTMSK